MVVASLVDVLQEPLTTQSLIDGVQRWLQEKAQKEVSDKEMKEKTGKKKLDADWFLELCQQLGAERSDRGGGTASGKEDRRKMFQEESLLLLFTTYLLLFIISSLLFIVLFLNHFRKRKSKTRI